MGREDHVEFRKGGKEIWKDWRKVTQGRGDKGKGREERGERGSIGE